ncbi:MAG: LptE family protein [Candidatus Zixiibacteriota bacterium]
MGSRIVHWFLGEKRNSRRIEKRMLNEHKKSVYCLLCTAYCLLLLTSGCGIYSFSGSGLSGIKTIAIPLFENETQEYGLREALTEKIAERFVQDNTLKVVNERTADSILRGVITKYTRESHTFDEQENPKEYIARIWVRVSFEEKKGKKIVWREDNLLGWGIFSAQDETEEMGKERAIEKLAEDIVNKTVKGW